MIQKEAQSDKIKEVEDITCTLIFSTLWPQTVSFRSSALYVSTLYIYRGISNHYDVTTTIMSCVTITIVIWVRTTCRSGPEDLGTAVE